MHGVLVHRHGLFQRAEVHIVRAGFIRHDARQGIRHILSRHGRAVMEQGVLADLELPGHLILQQLVALCQVHYQFAVVVLLDKVAVHVVQHRTWCCRCSAPAGLSSAGRPFMARVSVVLSLPAAAEPALADAGALLLAGCRRSRPEQWPASEQQGKAQGRCEVSCSYFFLLLIRYTYSIFLSGQAG